MKTLMLLPFLLLPHGPSPSLKPVNLDFMLRGYFYAAAKKLPELVGAGGWGGSSNVPQLIASVPGRKGLEIRVDTMTMVPFAEKYEGRKVVLLNHGPDTLYFPAQDSRLDMKTQAMRNGAFADIEYLPSSWCGNSYHTLFLAPGEQWAFAMPKYSGKTSTRMRLEVRYGRKTGRAEGTEVFHSPPFQGGVNEAQFTEKQGHAAHDLMDPYNE